MAYFDKFSINETVYDVKDASAITKESQSVINVVDYGADPRGVNDSYTAFLSARNAAGRGGYVYVPYGTYQLSADPGHDCAWLIASGTKFTGNGVGSPSTGNGLFPCTTVSNPWLVTSGEYITIDLSGVPCPDGGAVNGASLEFKQQSNSGRYWRNLLYLGSDTGASANNQQHTELINLVENITGHQAIMAEFDLNCYADPGVFSSAIFLTGGGNVDCDITAVDITRDVGTKWTNGISIKQCDTGMAIDNETTDNGFVFGVVNRKNRAGVAIQQSVNGSDGIVIVRNTDSGQTGNLIVCWAADLSEELFAVGADGDIRAKSLSLNGSSIKPLQRKRVTSSSTSQGNNSIDITNQIDGLTPLLVGENSTTGFVSAITSVNLSGNTINYWLETGGTGTVEFTVLCQ